MHLLEYPIRFATVLVLIVFGARLIPAGHTVFLLYTGVFVFEGTCTLIQDVSENFEFLHSKVYCK